MTTFQKVIKYLAIAFAVFLAVSIIGGILGVTGIFSGLSEEDVLLDEPRNISISNNITSLNIDIAAAEITIKKSDKFTVESNLKHLDVIENDRELIIKEDSKYGIGYTDAFLTINLPNEIVFETAKISSGAGRVNIDRLSADSLKLEFGAGEVNIDSLVANKNAKIDGGAGKITISSGLLNNLDLDMGVGRLNLSGSVYGNSDFDLGVGESNFSFTGYEDDYSIDIEKGLGSISVNGKQIAEYHSVSGNNRIEIEGGMGAINLVFKTK